MLLCSGVAFVSMLFNCVTDRCITLCLLACSGSGHTSVFACRDEYKGVEDWLGSNRVSCDWKCNKPGPARRAQGLRRCVRASYCRPSHLTQPDLCIENELDTCYCICETFISLFPRVFLIFVSLHHCCCLFFRGSGVSSSAFPSR